jgi:hypothetical protein
LSDRGWGGGGALLCLEKRGRLRGPLLARRRRRGSAMSVECGVGKGYAVSGEGKCHMLCPENGVVFSALLVGVGGCGV